MYCFDAHYAGTVCDLCLLGLLQGRTLMHATMPITPVQHLTGP
ncbi:hypothetical protein OCH239_20715 [Roseivivax halodurans JCM 10272]|uniref:Uncharacterized protein n=1 Tax=Roseivivax halodurans JCM 10272 TaxID=1449350 RepID=X7EGC6_9RHOB|nr:hypothetical protein OCH239_20715 [Roseivivax halodurans JCM 10272]